MKHQRFTSLIVALLFAGTYVYPTIAWTSRTSTAGFFCKVGPSFPSPIQHRRLHHQQQRLISSTQLATSTNRDYESSVSASASSSSSSSAAASTSTTTTSIPTDSRYYSFLESPVLTQSCSSSSSSSGNNNNHTNGGPTTTTIPPVTLTRYLEQIVKQKPELRDLQSLLLAVQMACKTISHLINRAGLSATTTTTTTTMDESTAAAATATVSDENNNSSSSSINYQDGRYYSMKRLDQLSTLVLKNALKFTGKCEVVSPPAHLDSESPAQHQPGVLIAKSFSDNNNNNNNDGDDDSGANQEDINSYVAVLDPLDGSGNADASICTGTVFGVFEQPSALNYNNDETEPLPVRTQKLVDSVLQPAGNMRAAGYCLYSSATVLVFSLGEATVQGFTLDPQINEFVLTHPDLTIPARGNVYSCNEGNSEGWDESYKNYLRAIKTGKGQTQQRYAHRYVGSMVGDIHRTLLYGGIFAYPADTQAHPDGNLQLLYKTAPMAFVVHHAGGRAIDGRTGDLLQVRPERVHQKSPCFLGSPDDVAELETYIMKNKEGV